MIGVSLSEGTRAERADRPARGRDDGGVDADDAAVHVEQRAAGIAAVMAASFFRKLS